VFHESLEISSTKRQKYFSFAIATVEIMRSMDDAIHFAEDSQRRFLIANGIAMFIVCIMLEISERKLTSFVLWVTTQLA
jgi:hypothetical protein